MSDKRLFLLDAMALVYRAYYALVRSPRITSAGKNTNAQFGFTNTLVDLIKKENPSHMAVVWDTHAPTERHENFLDYKANRQAAPEDFLEAIPDIKTIIEGFNIPSIEVDGYEADDIVGTLAWQAADIGYEVYMVTPDKDYGQLVRDNIFIYKPGYKGGTFEILGPKEVCEKWGIAEVSQVIDILGLMGDAVDNIPGIPGVGEKTASKLLKEYHSLEGVLENADSIKGALGEKVRNGKESAVLSKMLATIITNVPIQFCEEKYTLGEWNKDALKDVFTQLEFKTLGTRLLGEDIVLTNPKAASKKSSQQGDLFASEDISQDEIKPFNTIKDIPHQYTLIDSLSALTDFVSKAMEQNVISIDTETTSLDARSAKILGISMAWKAHEAYYIPIDSNEEIQQQQISALRPLLHRKDVQWIGQNIKYDMIVLKNYDIHLSDNYFDTMLAHYSIAPESKQGMDFISRKILNYDPIPISDIIGPKGKNQLNMKDVPVEKVLEYAAEDADVTLQLKQQLEQSLQSENVQTLFEKVENPLAIVLAEMEYEGVKIDTDFLNEYAQQLGNIIKEKETAIYEYVGHSFNIASPKQLGEVLFDELKLDEKAKKTKTGQYATGEDVLQKLRAKHAIIDEILVFRELSKLKSTYADALPQMVNPQSGRVHSSFSQAVVVSGRLSSNNPNLQNIPIRTESGKEIRKAFIPRDASHILLSADYSQIELRVMAALSNDEGMIEAFQQRKDIHTATAARVYGVPESEVDSTMRRNAKSVNFGLIYGQSAFGLSQNLGIPRGEAQDIIAQYFKEYAQVKSFMDQLKEEAASKGYVSTIMGRRIKLADISSSNATLRGFAERLAINAPIQGSAADMIKMAMIAIRKAFIEENIQSKMILQVHDELVFDVRQDELEKVQKIVTHHMENALQLPNDVPIVAEWGTGKNWLDAH